MVKIVEGAGAVVAVIDAIAGVEIPDKVLGVDGNSDGANSGDSVLKGHLIARGDVDIGRDLDALLDILAITVLHAVSIGLLSGETIGGHEPGVGSVGCAAI